MVVIAAHLPEAALVRRHELDAVEELGTLPGVEVGRDDAGRGTVLTRDRLAVEGIGDDDVRPIRATRSKPSSTC